MKFLQDIFEKQKPHFEKGGKWEKFYYIFEAHFTLLFAPKDVTSKKGVQIRDAVDMKRMMMTVIIALLPTLIFGIWNVGHQHFLATGQEAATLLDKFAIGAYAVLPIVIVSYVTGLGIEFTFATIRRHPVNEGFLVSGMLIPLIMPATIPLWQVALATAFAVIIGKEVFGGTGMNILNVALTARAFLYFAYPGDISGDNVWTYFGDSLIGMSEPVQAFSGATPLAMAAADGISSFSNFWLSDAYTFQNMFLGVIPGSIGETSTLMALIGALILITTGVGSWRIILSVFGGAFLMGYLFNFIYDINYTGQLGTGVKIAFLLGTIILFIINQKFIKGELKAVIGVLAGMLIFTAVMLFSGAASEFMKVPAQFHLVMGGLAFGAVYMATDPVTASHTFQGKWIYGIMIGALTVLIRVFNPAYPEGIMLAILLMNVFAPLIDIYVVKANKKRRLSRATV
ncbi:RnfABCDGE type electron transport complex subunit D [Mangrovivirga sp. M17]|uniref:Na(+)-translocating NADH-quinone reductase subunit B n=1 Tax=Mangrovivirga halotolerans TaxID=2993936 RepID=A0ABT3RKW5_9BACT|nr:RnfABCDGE type electron transport complex subunit D [Mangrovivirga halotolerans]MCX2742454.1 RnfABCDGE type electron transport complex subunit D [Mangrovivirga halotolerans]